MKKTDRKVCLKCGKELHTSAVKCPHCGGRLVEDTKENRRIKYLEG